MPDYALKLYRYNPESGDAPRWDDYDVEFHREWRTNTADGSPGRVRHAPTPPAGWASRKDRRQGLRCPVRISTTRRRRPAALLSETKRGCPR